MPQVCVLLHFSLVVEEEVLPLVWKGWQGTLSQTLMLPCIYLPYWVQSISIFLLFGAFVHLQLESLILKRPELLDISGNFGFKKRSSVSSCKHFYYLCSCLPKSPVFIHFPVSPLWCFRIFFLSDRRAHYLVMSNLLSVSPGCVSSLRPGIPFILFIIIIRQTDLQ